MGARYRVALNVAAKKADTHAVIPKACELNPYSGSFNPAKYFAYTKRPEQTTVVIIAEDNEAFIKLVKRPAAWRCDICRAPIA